jgi:hypothetical protein
VELRSNLNTQQATLERQGFRVESRIVPGFAKTEVSQGRGFVAEALLGSVSHQVARRAEAAVLLIPAWDKT